VSRDVLCLPWVAASFGRGWPPVTEPPATVLAASSVDGVDDADKCRRSGRVDTTVIAAVKPLLKSTASFAVSVMMRPEPFCREYTTSEVSVVRWAVFDVYGAIWDAATLRSPVKNPLPVWETCPPQDRLILSASTGYG
jgi:hypothetical protein